MDPFPSEREPVVRTRVPLRISFGGGGTDVMPYAAQHGGVTLNATIARYVHCSVWPLTGRKMDVQVTNWDRVARSGDAGGPDRDRLLVEAVLARINAHWKRGLAIHLHSEAPPGSGLGSSSAMVVACLLSLARFLGVVVSAQQVADLAYRIERIDLGVSGGLQDQYATAFGGINWTVYGANEVRVSPVFIRPSVMHDLELRLMLWHTGQTHLSGGILRDQIDAYERQDRDVLDRLNDMKALAAQMREALELGDLDLFGHLLDTSWQKKRNLTRAISNDLIDTLYTAGRRAGALGGKVIGAGGGGYVLFYVPERQRAMVIQELSKVGGHYGGSVYFHLGGPHTWTSEAFTAKASAFIL